MKILNTYLIALISALSASTQIFAASSSITYDFDSLRTSGGTALSTSCVAVFIVDSDGDGILPTAADLLGIVLNEGTIVGGTTVADGDRIFSAGLTNGFYGPQNHAGTITFDYSVNGVEDAGNAIWGIYWFPTLSSLSLTPLAAGTSFGYFRTSVVDTAAESLAGQSSLAMVMPAVGTPSFNVFSYDATVVATPTANTPSVADFSANFTVVPEPATFTLSLLGMGLLLRRRRA